MFITVRVTGGLHDRGMSMLQRRSLEDDRHEIPALSDFLHKSPTPPQPLERVEDSVSLASHLPMLVNSGRQENSLDSSYGQSQCS